MPHYYSSSAYELFPFVGKGKVYLGPYAGGSGRFFRGNIDSLELSSELEEKSLVDFTAAGGGEYDAFDRISAIRANMNLRELRPDNIATMMAGTESAIATASVTNEEVTAYQGALVKSLYPLDTAQTVTVTNDSATWQASTAYALNAFVVDTGANGHMYKCTVAGTSDSGEPTFPTDGTTVADNTVTWTDMGTFAAVSGTNFTVTAHGIIPTVAASGGIADGLPIEMDYEKAAGWSVEIATSTSIEYDLVFVGINEAKSDRPCTLHLPRVKVPPGSIQLIGDDYWSGTVAAKVLQHNSSYGDIFYASA